MTTPMPSQTTRDLPANNSRVASVGISRPARGAAQRPPNAENSNGCSRTPNPSPFRISAQYARASAISWLPVARETAPSLARCADAATLGGDQLRALHQVRDIPELLTGERHQRSAHRSADEPNAIHRRLHPGHTKITDDLRAERR